MSEITKMTVNAITGVALVTELSAEEKTQLKNYADKEQAKEDAILAQANARKSALAKLADLGLTEEEIAAL